ncbi:MAG: SCO family protein [Hyphomicrobiaceae bacterium]|nr:MAG: SCO family protein [Hyphomicrobiaceae bacterium]
MLTKRRLALALAGTLIAAPAAAHHPGQNLDKVMGSKERYFQVIDRPAPEFTLSDAGGRVVSNPDFKGKVLALHFIFASCMDVCPLHANKIAEAQELVNASPMKDQVRFVSITTDPDRDTPEVLRSFGPARGLDAANWAFLTIAPGQSEESTRNLAEAFGHKFTKYPDGTQLHGIVTHVIDQQGIWRANFHGLRFDPVNLVLYVNGLVNETQPRSVPAKPGLWAWLRSLLF